MREGDVMNYARIEKGGGVAVVWLDQPGEKVNKISLDLLEEFKALLDEMERDDDVKGAVLISNKEDSFIAGADIDRIREADSPEYAESLSRRGHDLLNRLENLRKPVVAAIHGAALGGGLEVALACRYRIASDDPRTVLALPEVRLGLLPAGGGTQRLPRLIGLQAALDIMLTGKNVYARQAKRMGLVDDLVHPYGLLRAARIAALELAGKPMKRKIRQPFVAGLLQSNRFSRNLVYKKAEELVQKQTWGNYPAPFRIIDCVRTGLEQGMAAGLEAEATKFGELSMTPQSRELVQIFFSMTALKKNPRKDLVRPVRKIAVLGAGLMGSGIANVSAVNGMEVLLKDVSLDAAGQGEKAVWEDLSGKVRKRAMTPFQRDRIFSRITATDHDGGFEKADLVIEAVFEDLDLKKKILAETEAVLHDDAVFASNTSSIPIAMIAGASRRPGQVIGMHYFSPVPKMPLLEIIVTPKTEPWVTATALDAGIRQGKTVIVVNDGPGFYTTRILAALMNEALEVLDEGGDIKDIDRAMRRFGFPVGPVTLLDEVGIDVGVHVSRILGKLFAGRDVKPSAAMEKLSQAGFKGRKNNRGFYRYDDLPGKGKGKKKKEVNPDVYAFFGGPQRKNINPAEIQNRLSLVMVNEAAWCLQEGILNSPRDGDIGAVFGLGFPPFLGGPFRYLDRMGLAKALVLFAGFEKRHGLRFSAAAILRDYERTNRRFYP